MASYKDKQGREWVIELNFALADAIKTRHKIDVIDLTGVGKAFVEFAYSDMRLLGELLYTLCEEEITRLKLSPEDFGRAHTGPVLMEAKRAIEEAITDFSQSPEQADVKRKLFRAANQTVAKRTGELTEQFLAEKMYGDAALSMPELLESTIERIRSGNLNTPLMQDGGTIGKE